MITAAEKRIIKDGFERLSVLDNQTHTTYRRNLFNANQKDERQHRNGWCDGRGYPKSATVKDSLHIKETAIQAQALAENYAEILTEQFGGFDRDGFKSLDYSTMVATDD